MNKPTHTVNVSHQRDSAGDFRVYHKIDGKVVPDDTYYTSDKDDARDTADAMRKHFCKATK